MTRVTIRYWAAAKSAAGVAEDQVEADTLDEALRLAVASRGVALERVLARCSFLVDGVRADRTAALPSGGTIEVLPPFAGG
jgi:molybdopterin synthase sulfur carrier subunit